MSRRCPQPQILLLKGRRCRGGLSSAAFVVEAACLLANAFGVLSRNAWVPRLRVRTRTPTPLRLRVRTRASTTETETVKAFAAGATNAFPNSPRCFSHTRLFISRLYGLFTTTCGADLLISTWALTFWICAACSLNCAVKTSIPFAC